MRSFALACARARCAVASQRRVAVRMRPLTPLARALTINGDRQWRRHRRGGDKLHRRLNAPLDAAAIAVAPHKMLCYARRAVRAVGRCEARVPASCGRVAIYGRCNAHARAHWRRQRWRRRAAARPIAHARALIYHDCEAFEVSAAARSDGARERARVDERIFISNNSEAATLVARVRVERGAKKNWAIRTFALLTIRIVAHAVCLPIGKRKALTIDEKREDDEQRDDAARRRGGK